MNIGDITDVDLLKKMLHAANAHAVRCATKEIEDVDGVKIPNPEFNLDKAADLQVDIVAVKTRLDELANG